jgi:hypothetical protein
MKIVGCDLHTRTGGPGFEFANATTTVGAPLLRFLQGRVYHGC